MFRFLGLCFGTLVRLLRSRQRLLENMVLRQQLVVLKRRHRRPRLDRFDRLFWLLVRRCWSDWKEALLVVTPETAVRWHRAGFRWYWTVISKPRKPIARRRTSQEVRDLNFQMVAENPTWGARREILTESQLWFSLCFVFKYSRKGIALCYAGAWMRFWRRTPARQLFLRAIACPLEHFDAIGFAARRVEDFAVAYALESGAHQADSQHVAGRI